MHSTDGTCFCRKRNVILDGHFFDSMMGKIVAAIGAREEAALVYEKFWLDDKTSTDRAGGDLYALAFPAIALAFVKSSICLSVIARTSWLRLCVLYHSIVAANPFFNPQVGFQPNRVRAFVESSLNKPASCGPPSCSTDPLAP